MGVQASHVSASGAINGPNSALPTCRSGMSVPTRTLCTQLARRGFSRARSCSDASALHLASMQREEKATAKPRSSMCGANARARASADVARSVRATAGGGHCRPAGWTWRCASSRISPSMMEIGLSCVCAKQGVQAAPARPRPTWSKSLGLSPPTCRHEDNVQSQQAR